MTIRDIADLAGVSVATVSYILNGKPGRYSPTTRDRVLALVKEHRYQRDFTAQSLARGRSDLIALALPLSMKDDRSTALLRDNPFYGEFIDAMMEVSTPRGMDILIGGFSHGGDIIPWLNKRRPDGLVLLGSAFPEAGLRSFFPDLAVAVVDVPLETFHTADLASGPCLLVGTDDWKAAYQGTSWLLGEVPGALAFVGGDTGDGGVHQLRYHGFLDAHRDLGRETRGDLVFQGEVSFSGGQRLGQALAQARPQGIFCSADIMALGLLRGLGKAGCAIPDDMVLLGFDNISLGIQATPSLSTMDQDIRAKGRATAQGLLDLLDHPWTSKDGSPGVPRSVTVEHHLLRRESTGTIGRDLP